MSASNLKYRVAPVERLHELFEARDGKLYARAASGTRWLAGRRVGSVSDSGHRAVSVDGVKLYEHRVMYAMTHGEWPTSDVDHRNQSKADNVPNNLRLSDHSRNAQNAGIRRDNTSGYRNVSWDAARQKYTVHVTRRGKTYTFGRHDDLEFADLVAQEARRKLFGSFAPKY